jgi:hypothetical protein
MRFDVFTTVVAFIVGTAVGPYISLVYEFWLTRPRKFDQRDPFDHCKGCTL